MNKPTFATAEAALAHCIDQLKNNAKALCWSSREGDEVLHYDTIQGQYIIRFYGAQNDGPHVAPQLEHQAINKMQSAIVESEGQYVIEVAFVKA